MPTARLFNRRAYQCSLYEAQDVLTEIDEVDLLGLEPTHGFRIKERWQRRLLFHDFSRKLVQLNPGLRRVPLDWDYDLFVAVCQNQWDLLYVNAIDGWQDHCTTSVCWLDEFWAADVATYKYWLHALRKFDHVFIGCRGTVAPLSEAIGRACHWLPGAVDAFRFSPYPEPPLRGIDVYSIGRRWEGTHRALIEAAGRGDTFYVYDTFPAMANMVPYDHRQHRDLFANLIKRSRYFVVAPAKMNLPEETQGQIEIGYRYIEGAAAGAAMIGDLPDCEAFREAFPWPDAVLPVRPDGSDIIEVMAALDSEPSRLEQIRRRNAVESLLRHDWVYRWKKILQVAGIEPSPELVGREERLRVLAKRASDTAEAVAKRDAEGADSAQCAYEPPQ